MLRLAFQGLRGRKGPFAGAFVALSIAAALVMACGTLLQAGLRSQAPVERYAATPIVVAGEQKARIGVGTENEDSIALFERARISAALVTRVAAVPGVRAAIVDTSTPAQIRTANETVEGPTGHAAAVHPWSSSVLTPYALTAGRHPAGPAEVVVDAGMARRGRLEVGERVRLSSNGPAQGMTVVGIVATKSDVTRQGVMFVTSATAERLAGLPGRADAIGVLPAPGVDRAALAGRVRDAVEGRARVVTGGGRGEVEHIETIEAKEAVTTIGASFGAIALLIAMFVVASAVALSVMQREREVALLRAIAATPKQVRRMIAWEALLIGLVASAVGLVPGAALAKLLGSALANRGIAPEDLEVAIGILPALAAVGCSVLTALIAVAAAGRRAARVQPTLALRESSLEPRMIGPVRLLGGLLALGASLALLWLATRGGDVNSASDAAAGVSLTLVVAVAFLGPLLARAAAWLVGRALARSRRISGVLAASNVRTSPRRFASAMTPLVLTVALSCTMLFLASTRGHAATEQAGQRVVADLVLHSDGVGLPRDAVEAARAVPGVGTAVATASTTLGPSLGGTYQAIPAAVLDPRGISRVLDLGVLKGSVENLDENAVALSETRAEVANAAVGDRLPIALGDGTRRQVRVAAVYSRGMGFGDVVLSSALVNGHRTSPTLDSVLIRLAPGAQREQVAARLASLSATYPGLTVGDRHDLAVRVDANRQTNEWLFNILVAIVFVFTAVAVVNTLTMIAVHRTRELALLQLIGATPRQVRAMARWEAGLLVTLGLGLGAGISLITLMPTSDLLTGSPIPYAPAGLIALVFGSAAAVGFLGSQLSTRLAMRSRPVDAIGLRD